MSAGCRRLAARNGNREVTQPGARAASRARPKMRQIDEELLRQAIEQELGPRPTPGRVGDLANLLLSLVDELELRATTVEGEFKRARRPLDLVSLAGLPGASCSGYTKFTRSQSRARVMLSSDKLEFRVSDPDH